MRDDGKGILGDWNATGHKIRDAMEVAVQKAVREHKDAGRSVVVWDREKDEVVVLEPDQIDVRDDMGERQAQTNGIGSHHPSAPLTSD